MSNPVGLIGIGLMGNAFARRLLDVGFDVLGFDIDPAKRDQLKALGGEPAASVADMARRCDRIVLAVLTVSQVEDVLEGEGGLLANRSDRDGDCVILCTGTYEPDRIAALADRVAPKGAIILDTPVSGTSQQVLHGDGLGLIGGDPAVATKVSDILEVIYPRRKETGSAGSATKTKLAINHILGLNRVALAEGLVFAERLGLDKANFLDVARQSAAYSQIMDIKGGKMVEGDFTPVSKVSQHLKDVRIMVEEAKQRGQELPFAALLVDILEACQRHGDGDRDNAITIEEIRRRAAI